MLRACRGLWRWALASAVLLGLMMAGTEASASTYSTGTNACSGCHGVAGLGTPPLLPSQFSNILVGADLTQSCTGGSCSLKSVIAANATMGAGGVNVLGSFTDAQLDTVRLYLLQVHDGAISNGAPSFSSTLIGQNTTSTISVTISNFRGDDGAGSDGHVSYGFNVSPGSDFSLVSPLSTANCAATTTTSANTCTVNVTVRFTPTASGTRTGTLNVVVNAADTVNDPNPSDKAIALSATGVTPTPTFSLSTNSLSFTGKVGSTVTNTVTISNPGTANLVLSSLNFTPAQFSRASGCNAGTTIVPGGNCVLTVNFSPSAPGATNGSVTISHNAAGSPDTVTLNGTGTQATLAASSTSLAFDNVQLGVPKTLPAITVTNTATAPTATLVFATDPTSAGARSGSGAADYSVASSCSTGSPLPALGSCTITVTFTPSTLGPRPATLTVASDATNTPLVIGFTGTGVALPEPTVTFPATDFPDTVIGETAAQTRQVTITNDRTRNISYTVADTTDFKISAETCPTRVVPGGGGSCTITWRFSPTLGVGEGRRQVTIPITFAGTLGDVAPSPVSGTLAGMALLPILQSATALNAAAVVGSPTTVSMLLTNRSASGVALTSFGFSGAAGSDYSLDASNGCVPASTLASGASCTLVIRFNPPTAGTRDATLTITHGAPGSPQSVALHGTATPAPQGRIALSALSLTFADTQLGSNTTQTITVQNTGDLALNFSAFNLAGTAAPEYSRGGTCAVGTPLAISAQCTVTVTFAPTVLGTRSASLTIQSDASNGPATISLTGTGVPVPAPQVSLVPASLDFGVQTVGGIYPKRTVRLSNSGTADLTITALAVEGTAFTDASSTPCPSTLAPGAGCDIEILFSAAAPGTSYTGTVRVTSNAAGSPHTAPLVGTGSAAAVPVLVWAPVVTQLDFGTVATGTVSAAQSVTLQNQGPGGVSLTVLNAVGPGAASYSVTGGTCQVGQSLFEGQTCTIDVRFAPSTAGAKAASVQIASTGSFPPTLALTGTGLGGPTPALSLSTATLSFDATRVGDRSQPLELRISSAGSGTVQITAIDMTGPYTMQAKTCPGLPFSLPAGSDCTVTVTFAPQAEGDTNGTLRVTSDADPATSEVALSGRGEPKADLSSGGCTIGPADAAMDPTLWTLVLLAALVLWQRRRGRR